MKKLVSFLLVSVCLLAGCTNDKNIKKYEDAMKQIKAHYPSCTLEIKCEHGLNVSYYKIMIKDDKWKVEEFLEDRDHYTSGILYDGNERLDYYQDEPYARIHPFINSTTNSEYKSEELIKPDIATNLLYWYEPAVIRLKPIKLESISNKKEIINGFECRMLRYENKEEVCVSEQYGIAVYRKVKTELLGDTIYNLLKIDTSDIADTEFQLPEGKKKIDYNSYMNELNSYINELNKKNETIDF